MSPSPRTELAAHRPGVTDWERVRGFERLCRSAGFRTPLSGKDVGCGASWCEEAVRKFILVRDHDPSGVSGVGEVAEGVVFSDGTVALRWRSDHASTAFYTSLRDVEKIHGHNGCTRTVFIEDPGSLPRASRQMPRPRGPVAGDDQTSRPAVAG